MQIQDKTDSRTFAIDLGEFRVEMVQDVLGISQPSEGTLGEVRITRGLDRSKAFTDWIERTLADDDAESARQDITITVMDADRKPGRRIRLLRALPTSWTEPALDAEDAEPASESVTVAYEEMRIE
ncbi:phage tail protein [Nocardia vinacea]|uniref:phage tail protein n=1 Tax=Nocardia vinacea TaxID=96468 RepID=UPI0002DE04D0|nr:phage tail protein [Nocardia vinacea]